MEETLASFVTAQLAREKGFKEETFSLYDKNGKLIWLNIEESEPYSNDYNDQYSAPTLSLLQKWFRKVHKINIEIRYYGGGHWSAEGYKITDPNQENDFNELFKIIIPQDPDIVLDLGLQTALRLIKD